MQRFAELDGNLFLVLWDLWNVLEEKPLLVSSRLFVMTLTMHRCEHLCLCKEILSHM